MIGTLRLRIARPRIAASILREFSGSVLPVSPLHWSLASPLDPLSPFPLILRLPSIPLSLSFSLSLTAVFLYFHPVPLLPSCCLPLATPTRCAWRHAANTWAKFKHLLSSSFRDSLRPLSKSGLGGQKNAAGSKIQSYFLFWAIHRIIILGIIFSSGPRMNLLVHFDSLHFVGSISLVSLLFSKNNTLLFCFRDIYSCILYYIFILWQWMKGLVNLMFLQRRFSR